MLKATELKAIELNEETFKPFGTVLSSKEVRKESGDVNPEFTYIKRVFSDNTDKLSSGLMTCKKRDMILNKMEKHDHSPEIMVNIGGDAVLVLAERDYGFSGVTDKIKAFYVKKGDAIVLHPGIWHWSSYPVEDEDVDYLTVYSAGNEIGYIDHKDLELPINLSF